MKVSIEFESDDERIDGLVRSFFYYLFVEGLFMPEVVEKVLQDMSVIDYRAEVIEGD